MCIRDRSGTLVLYNNMLQSLFQSQIATAGVVITGIAIMLLILFRSIVVALIGTVPNVLASGLVLGLMGLAGVPLDMMTITVAAISLGIAVDNSIHYMYRFKEQVEQGWSYEETVGFAHGSVGQAMFFTSVTVVGGFSILMVSNFIPTIYFGVLTAIAMTAALVAALTLLPRLVLIFRPFSARAA